MSTSILHTTRFAIFSTEEDPWFLKAVYWDLQENFQSNIQKQVNSSTEAQDFITTNVNPAVQNYVKNAEQVSESGLTMVSSLRSEEKVTGYQKFFKWAL